MGVLMYPPCLSYPLPASGSMYPRDLYPLLGGNSRNTRETCPRDARRGARGMGPLVLFVLRSGGWSLVYRRVHRHLHSFYTLYLNFIVYVLHANWLCTPLLGARGCTPIPEVYPPPQAVPPSLEQERHRLH